ncbi:MAG: YibE/F family protein, partial [Rhodospirillaceae bacterium]
AACAALWFRPTGFEARLPGGVSVVRGTVVEADNQRVRQYGLVREGEQRLRVRIEEGAFAGQLIDAENLIMGKMELDAFFRPGDRALVNLSAEGNKVTAARAVDHYRLDLEFGLFAAFAVLLLALGFSSGLRALLSFVFTVLMIWRVMVPLFLKGYDPILVGFAATAVILAAIVALVGGLDRRGCVAFAGAFLGLGAACALAVWLSAAFKLNGAVRPFSETLLYSGFPGLDLSGLFIAGIFIAGSGAMVDLAMDVAVSMSEIARHRPDLPRRELFTSALAVARAVTGTMTTTLLLAYSGGYVTMLMLFMGQGVPLANVLNLGYVAAEIFHTMVGSIALIATAPFTALVGTFAFAGRTAAPEEEEESSVPLAAG